MGDDNGFKLVSAKSFKIPLIRKQELGVMECAYHPSCNEKTNRRIQVQRCKKCDPHLQNSQSKKGWRCDSSNRALSSKARSSEFKPQYHFKKKEKRNTKMEGPLETSSKTFNTEG
jgi:hypothetical protein